MSPSISMNESDPQRLNRLIEFVFPLCECPCCRMDRVCYEECTFKEDCPGEWQQMIDARKALFGDTKPQNK